MTDVVVEVVERAEEVIVEAGARGKPGKAGRDGTDGSDGRDGADGRDGEKGDPGDDGRPGDKGDTGDKGDPGQDGADGRAGEKGDKGDPGGDGSDGQDGADGRDGQDGNDGQDGAPGREGPAGTTEWSGLTGRPTIYSEFAIWAEENSDIETGTYEWAFGNGANTPSGAGITLPFDCELFAITLALYGAASTEVEARKNTGTSGKSVATTSSTSGVSNFVDSPVAFAAGDRINFRTVTGSSASNGAVVTAWFRRAVA